ncbi:MAG: flagellar hook capping FlgD N-terminal domain-containing protein [Ilumatobacteraceae bacterium]
MAAIGGITAANPATATSSKPDIFSGMGPDAFLKLLVAQMRYQNPMSPSDPTAMMGQLAQYAQVEALTKVQQGQAVDQSLSEARMATDLVGKAVTASDGKTTESGKVLSARFTATGPVLVLDTGAEVTLSAVTQVDMPVAAPTASPVPPAATTPATPKVATPAASTVSTPATADVTTPATSDVTAPVTPPVTTPAIDPVTSPVTPPVTPVVTPPAIDPVTTSVTTAATDPVTT